jgi:lipoprotein signal peptidase
MADERPAARSDRLARIEPTARRRHRRVLIVVAVFVVVIGTDQATKWLAWRGIDGALINDGGYILLSPVIRSWFAGPTTGAVANAVGLLLVLAGVIWLLRRWRALPTVVGGALVAAGWASNLLDRIGLHEWSAPDSPRGVVDFIPSGGVSRCNIADLWIVLGALVLGYAIGRRRHANMPSGR